MKKTILKVGLGLLISGIFLFGCGEDDAIDVVTGEGVFTTPSGSAIIEGELFLPDGNGPFPSMIIVGGSGNELRSEFEPFAEQLNQNGYALYIFDKRGIGGSTGSYPVEEQPTQRVFLNARADDVLGIIDLLKTHEQIDNNRIGLFGSSQGAWVNALVHDHSADLSYMVMASGGVASTGLEMFYCDLTDDPAVTIAEATTQLANYNGPVGFDPLSIIQNMTLPVLWIYGDQDRSHPWAYDTAALNNMDKANFTVQVFQGMDHELIDVATGVNPVNLFPSLGAWVTQNN